MKVIITCQGKTLEDKVDPRFGRCAYFLLADTEGGCVEAVANPGAQAAGGAGPLAAQKVGELGAEAVITGNVGPKAADSLAALKLKVYQANEGTAKEALEAFGAGGLKEIVGASVGQHSGMR